MAALVTADLFYRVMVSYVDFVSLTVKYYCTVILIRFFNIRLYKVECALTHDFKSVNILRYIVMKKTIKPLSTNCCLNIIMACGLK